MSTPIRACSLILGAALMLTTACGDDSDDGEVSDGTVTAALEEYCVATFTESYAVKDVFDDPLFTAASGSKYLVSGFRSGFSGSDRVEMFFLSSVGPIDFEIEIEEGQQAPFTMNCEDGSTKRYAGVFTDVTLYKDVELTEQACTLTAGTVVETSGGGFSAEGGLEGLFEDLFAPVLYNVELGDLSAQCDGNTSAYINVPTVEVLGVYQAPVPIRIFVGPGE